VVKRLICAARRGRHGTLVLRHLPLPLQGSLHIAHLEHFKLKIPSDARRWTPTAWSCSGWWRISPLSHASMEAIGSPSNTALLTGYSLPVINFRTLNIRLGLYSESHAVKELYSIWISRVGYTYTLEDMSPPRTHCAAPIDHSRARDHAQEPSR